MVMKKDKEIIYAFEFHKEPNLDKYEQFRGKTLYDFRIVSNNGILVNKLEFKDIWEIFKNFMITQEDKGNITPEQIHQEVFKCNKNNPCKFKGCPFGKKISKKFKYF